MPFRQSCASSKQLPDDCTQRETRSSNLEPFCSIYCERFLEISCWSTKLLVFKCDVLLVRFLNFMYIFNINLVLAQGLNAVVLGRSPRISIVLELTPDTCHIALLSNQFYSRLLQTRDNFPYCLIVIKFPSTDFTYMTRYSSA